MPQPISRRTVLRGVGTAMALPWLEAMLPGGRAGRALAATAADGAGPMRALFVFVPNGVNYERWRPDPADPTALSPTLAPLAAHRADVSVVTGLAHANAAALGDGPGDHARSAACFLTGAHPVKTAGSDIRAGVSFDQVLAERLGGATRLPSLELGCERAMLSGDCDSGYSCAYSANISWRAPDAPTAKEIDPRRLFERLFMLGADGETVEARARRLASRRSILDYVGGEAKRLHARLGTGDRRRMDEYLDGVRALERRIELVEQAERDPVAAAGMPKPDGVPDDYREHLDLMQELLVVALRLDLTRVATLMYANEGSNRPYPFLGIRDGHHHLTHHSGDAEMIEKVRTIDRFRMEAFAGLLDRLAATPEEDVRLLDRTAVVFGSAISDGNRHDHRDLPVVVAGGGLSCLGRNVVVPDGTPMCDLFLTIGDAVGARIDTFGDARGRLRI